MYREKIIAVIIPALNEEENIPLVLGDIPPFVDRIFVTDNGSTDGTAEAASNHGAIVLREKRKGYGWACLKAMEALTDEDIVVFLDGDYSDYPEKMNLLLDPVIDGICDTVISNRFTGQLQKGAMSFPQWFGNKLSVLLIRLFWSFRFNDLGPFRSITRSALDSLNMEDKNFGWTIELQIKAIQKGLNICQVDVPYRVRERGKSKVSKTVGGVFKAGFKIIWLIFYYRIRQVFFSPGPLYRPEE